MVFEDEITVPEDTDCGTAKAHDKCGKSGWISPLLLSEAARLEQVAVSTLSTLV